MVIRPILGRLHCGWVGLGVIGALVVVIRPILGRLHCGSAFSASLPSELAVIRPILGRLHCGAMAFADYVSRVVKSSGRSSAGSIAARSSPRSAARRRQVIRPILGRLHCGNARGRRSGGRHIGHPADPRPAPLRHPYVPDSSDHEHGSSGRSSAGSIAANSAAIPGDRRRSHPADPRPAPLRHPYRAPAIAARGVVIRPILGRLHCGVAWSALATSTGSSHPADPRPAPLRPPRHRSPPMAAMARHPADPRPAPLRPAESVLSGIRHAPVIRPILGRLHCGRHVADDRVDGAGRHPADPRPAPLRLN